MSLYDDKSKIYIGHLPLNISESDIEYYFRPYGYIKNIKLVNSFAFIQYGNNDSAKNAILNMNYKILNGKKITVQYAFNKETLEKMRSKQLEDDNSNSSNKFSLSQNDKIKSIIPICSYCGKKGHWMDECILLFKYLKKKESKDYFKECFKCGSKEHLEKDCPILNNNNRSKSRSRSRNRSHSGSYIRNVKMRKYSDSDSRSDYYNSRKYLNRKYSSINYSDNSNDDKYNSDSSYLTDK